MQPSSSKRTIADAASDVTPQVSAPKHTAKPDPQAAFVYFSLPRGFDVDLDQFTYSARHKGPYPVAKAVFDGPLEGLLSLLGSLTGTPVCLLRTTPADASYCEQHDLPKDVDVLILKEGVVCGMKERHGPNCCHDTSNREVQLFVKTFTGRTKTLEIALSKKGVDLKKAIDQMEQIPPEQQRIYYAGHQIEDHETLAACGVMKESTIHLVLRLRAGMFHQTSGAASTDILPEMHTVQVRTPTGMARFVVDVHTETLLSLFLKLKAVDGAGEHTLTGPYCQSNWIISGARCTPLATEDAHQPTLSELKITGATPLRYQLRPREEPERTQ